MFVSYCCAYVFIGFLCVLVFFISVSYVVSCCLCFYCCLSYVFILLFSYGFRICVYYCSYFPYVCNRFFLFVFLCVSYFVLSYSYVLLWLYYMFFLFFIMISCFLSYLCLIVFLFCLSCS